MSFESFTNVYGLPAANTAANLDSLKLTHSRQLVEFVDQVGGGTFHNGFISLASEREMIDDLGGWEHWLPLGSRLFGSSAFGFLMTTQGTNVWTVDTQYGQVVESSYSVREFINLLSKVEIRDDILGAPLFHAWSQMAGPLPLNSVLCPVPAIPLGGTWSPLQLSVMTFPVYLSFTAQIFEPQGGMPAEIRRLD